MGQVKLAYFNIKEETMIKFLKDIYDRQCENGDYVVLAALSLEGKWRDYPIKYHENTIDKNLKLFFDTYPSEEYDLYWSPMAYSEPKRQNAVGLETKFLAQDIDELSDLELLTVKPSYYWESSPNKYQGLWELDRYLEGVEDYTRFNQALAEHEDFDDCFDFPHVYRIPGSINHKYKNKPKVGEVVATKEIYRPSTIASEIGFKFNESTTNVSKDKTSDPDADMKERQIYAKYNIPSKVREYLALDDLSSIDRSKTIWFIENALFELGMTQDEIIHLVKRSAFNKFKGRHDEMEQLRRELLKVTDNKLTEATKGSENELVLTSFREVMGNPSSFQGWLVKDFWGRRSHGLVAGLPKTFKSTVVHDFAISIASGRPFLGKYPVLESGPVLLVQNENNEFILKDRTERIMKDRNLVGRVEYEVGNPIVGLRFQEDLPIYFINQQGFDLSNGDHRSQLEKTLKQLKPVLVILDPLYLMFSGDLNSGEELNPVLNWLLSLKTTYNTSVMVIHHYNKGGSDKSRKGGTRMAGSVYLYGWIESAWYLTRDDDGEDLKDENGNVVRMTREFRFADQPGDLDLVIQMGDEDDPSYKVHTKLPGKEGYEKRDIAKEVLDTIRHSGTISLSDLITRLGLKRSEARTATNQLVNSNDIVEVSRRTFMLYK